jgi:sugar transferase (PEP-CTERM/EpsH1 system associated)
MPAALRIMHVVHAFSAGGIENGIVNIINRSPEHLSHELCLLSKSGEFIDRLTRPVVVHEMNKRNGNGVRIILQLRELFRKRGVDIIHTRNWSAFDAVIAACLTARPVLIHGEHGRDISDPNGQVYRRNLTRRLLAFRARKFVAVSRDLYRWLKQTVHIPIRKLAFIPNGVDTDRFSPGRDAELRRELGIDVDEFVLGIIGRLDPVKNHQGLIRAVNQLQKSGYPVRLVIVGDGPLCNEIRSAAEGLLQAPKPLLVGYRADVQRLYRIFDTFVLNSFAEGMSNTLLEAMASGVPIICTAVGGNVELVTNQETGTLIPAGRDDLLAEAVRRYVDSSGQRSAYAQNARRFAIENFSIRHMIQQYTALYESVA